MSDRNGTRRSIVSFSVEIMPPSTTVSPSATLTVAWAVTVSTRGERMIGAVHRDGHGNAFLFRADLGFLGVDFHDHVSVRADPRRDAQDQTDVLVGDRVGLAVRADRGADDPRHALADLDERRLVVERAHQRPAEDVQLARFLQRPNQDADVLAAGRQHEPAEARIVVHASEGEVRECLAADLFLPVAREDVVPLLPKSLVVEIETGRDGGGLDDLLGDRHDAVGDRTSEWCWSS